MRTIRPRQAFLRLVNRYPRAVGIVACAGAAYAAPFTMLPLFLGALCPPGRSRPYLAAGAIVVTAAYCLVAMPSALPVLAGGVTVEGRVPEGALMAVLVPASVGCIVAGGILLRQAWFNGDPRDAVVRASLAVMLVFGSGMAVESAGRDGDLRVARATGFADGALEFAARLRQLAASCQGPERAPRSAPPKAEGDPI